MANNKPPEIDWSQWKNDNPLVEVVDRPPLTSFMVDEKTLGEKDIKPTQWLFPLLLPSPALVGLVGRPGCYKTFFGHWIAKRLSEGKDLFDQYDELPQWDIDHDKEPVNTLIIEEEMGEEIVQERIHTLSPHDESRVHWMINSGFKLLKGRREIDEERVDELVKIIEEKEIKVLILDPFISIAGMEDENDNAEANYVMKILLDKFVNNGPKITVIFIHHPSKSSDGDVMRGAGDILGKSYVGLALDKVSNDGTLVKVKCIKTRWYWPKTFTMDFRKNQDKGEKDGQLEFVYIGREDKPKTKKDELGQEIVYFLKREPEGLTKVQLSRLLDRKGDPKKDHTLGKAMKDLQSEGEVVMDPKTYVYSLK